MRLCILATCDFELKINQRFSVLTSEQKTIIDFIPEFLSSDIKNISLKAFAGTGKSFILKEIAKTYPDIRFLGLAFNSSIASENRKSFPKKNVKWFTLHGFAKEYLKKDTSLLFDLSLQKGSFRAIELIDILDIKDQGNFAFANAINQVMRVFCQSDLQKIEPDLIYKKGIKQKNFSILRMNNGVLEYACKYANKLFVLHKDGKLPPTFDFYLKFFELEGYAPKIKEFDMLELDEAQDSNDVTLSIVSQLPTKNIFVGDEHQSIYGFRGTTNAMNIADKTFYLSTTFRYNQEIADFANKILGGYKNESVKIKSAVKDRSANEGTKAFLSRNNSSMITLIDFLVKKGVAFSTVKKPEELFSNALALLEFRLDKSIRSPQYNYLKKFSHIEELEDYMEESSDVELMTAFRMQRQYGKRLYFLLKVAKENYKHRKNAKVFLSTAHTSKGLEWDSVELLSDFPNLRMKLKEARISSPDELISLVNKNHIVADSIVQEINLFYVACTRARYDLVPS